MKLKTILLTGVSGVIGRLVATNLIENFKIIAIGSEYSRIPESIRHHKNFKFYERNFLTINTTSELGILEPVDLVLHLAGVVSGSKISEIDYFKINSESTKLLLGLAKEKKSHAFGLASSVSVYGHHESNLSLESERLGSSVYARSKIAAENHCLGSSVPFSLFRIASVYGHGTKSFVSKLHSLFQKGIYPSFGKERKKSILHVEDLVSFLCAWCEAALEEKVVQPVYVLSHPEAVTISMVVEELRRQGKAKYKGIPIPIFGFLIPVFNFFYRRLRSLQGAPYHESPLYPLLSSVEIFDERSWKDLRLSPKWDLRKGISQYK
ncbi:NAD-dependent epimerase/dehydratase family protein [Leptospira ognonensis]|uniref:NAD-dependent epimerase/dehydratase family protein n=1 Tax=Leptospira ognonensis TaxID=2484945 RepID=A0A4R9K248_9LEPT|nr:NAD-dependent epimerase/dehydratase family protein [Leptospira ognonensis]TGL60069.1 NAD-dependent epimerase/dehydratase family protein [Leptospira ognonensis]